jgi:hypothetical protein
MADTDLIQIVDGNDKPVGSATRQDAQEQGFFHRVARITVESKDGDILLQKRGPLVKLTELVSKDVNQLTSGLIDTYEKLYRS